MATTTALPLARTKRLNINLSERAHTELQSLSTETNRSVTELIRLAVGLLKITLEASREGHRLVITTKDGQALREIVIPG
jgi:hypothetical protein